MAEQLSSSADTDLDTLLRFLKLLRGVVPKMPETVAEFPLWFANMECVFKVYCVPEAPECKLTLQFLSSDCRAEAARFMSRQQCTFTQLKLHVFEFMGLLPERLHELFGETEKLPDETWWSASVRASAILDAYLESRNVRSFEELKELLISDRIKAITGPEASRHVVLTECGSWMKPKELSRCLEHFEETDRNCRMSMNVSRRPKVAKEADAKKRRAQKRRKCFACKAVGHLIKERPAVCPKKESSASYLPDTSGCDSGEVGTRLAGPKVKPPGKKRFDREPARVWQQPGNVLDDDFGRRFGVSSQESLGLLGDLLCELAMVHQKRSHQSGRDRMWWRDR